MSPLFFYSLLGFFPTTRVGVFWAYNPLFFAPTLYPLVLDSDVGVTIIFAHLLFFTKAHTSLLRLLRCKVDDVLVERIHIRLSISQLLV